MHYAILNSSGNALGWFTDESEAQRALDEMRVETPDLDLDLVAFDSPGRPAEPITASTRSAWPTARLVSTTTTTTTVTATQTFGNMIVVSGSENGTDDRVEVVEA